VTVFPEALSLEVFPGFRENEQKSCSFHQGGLLGKKIELWSGLKFGGRDWDLVGRAPLVGTNSS
jgi:hypothetical protein